MAHIDDVRRAKQAVYAESREAKNNMGTNWARRNAILGPKTAQPAHRSSDAGDANVGATAQSPGGIPGTYHGPMKGAGAQEEIELLSLNPEGERREEREEKRRQQEEERRDELKKKTVTELRKEADRLQVETHKDMDKEELVDAIIGGQKKGGQSAGAADQTQDLPEQDEQAKAAAEREAANRSATAQKK